MPIDAVVESLDKVPEALRGEYEPREGKFHLRLAGEPSGFVPKARLDEFRTNNLELTRKAEQLAAQAEKFKDIDPDKARAALEKLQQIEDKKLIDSGKIDELVAARTERLVGEKDGRITELSTSLEAKTKEADEFKAELTRVLVGSHIDACALAHKVTPAGLKIVRLLAEHGDDQGVRWTLNDQRQLVAMKADGTPAWSGSNANKPLERDEWIEGIIKAYPHIVPPSSGGGAPGNTAGGGPTVDLSTLSPVERVKELRRQRAA